MILQYINDPNHFIIEKTHLTDKFKNPYSPLEYVKLIKIIKLKVDIDQNRWVIGYINNIYPKSDINTVEAEMVIVNPGNSHYYSKNQKIALLISDEPEMVPDPNNLLKKLL